MVKKKVNAIPTVPARTEVRRKLNDIIVVATVTWGELKVPKVEPKYVLGSKAKEMDVTLSFFKEEPSTPKYEGRSHTTEKYLFGNGKRYKEIQSGKGISLVTLTSVLGYLDGNYHQIVTDVFKLAFSVNFGVGMSTYGESYINNLPEFTVEELDQLIPFGDRTYRYTEFDVAAAIEVVKKLETIGTKGDPKLQLGQYEFIQVPKFKKIS